MFRWTGKTWEESIVTCIADFVKNNRHNSGFGALPDCFDPGGSDSVFFSDVKKRSGALCGPDKGNMVFCIIICKGQLHRECI